MNDGFVLLILYYLTLGLLPYVLCKCSIKLNMKSSGLFGDFGNEKSCSVLQWSWITSKLLFKKQQNKTTKLED